MATDSALRFEGFSLDLDRLCLFGPSGRIELRRKSFDVLRYLVERAGRVIPKEELMNAVWPDVTVGDESLTQCISEVRRALGDREQRIIKTLARRGYFIDVPVSATYGAAAAQGLRPLDAGEPVRKIKPKHLPVAPPDSAAARRTFNGPLLAVVAIALVAGLAVAGSLIWTSLRPALSTTPAMMAVPTIAILPFGVAGSEDQRALAAGIEAEIRSELARALRAFDLSIRAAEDSDPSSSPKPALTKRVTRYVVTGTTRVDGDGQRANVQLVDTDTGRQIWSESFEFDGRQNGAFHRMAARIARLLVIQIQTAESQLPLPANPEAGHYALLGRVAYEAERSPDGNRKAQALFEQALSLDANSVPGLLGFATTKVAQAVNAWIPAEERSSALTEASNAIDRVIRLDPRNAFGHVLRGSISRALGEVDKSIASLEYALSLSPNLYAVHSELAATKVSAGLAHEAVRHIEEALQLAPPEPNLQILYFFAGYAALHLADDAAAVKWFLKARQTNPAYPNAALWLAAAYVGIGDEQAARASLAEYMKEKPRFSIEGFKRFVPMPNPVVAKQRERIMDAWRRLGVPEDPPPLQVGH